MEGINFFACLYYCQVADWYERFICVINWSCMFGMLKEKFGFVLDAIENLALLDVADYVIQYIYTWLYAIHDILFLIYMLETQ